MKLNYKKTGETGQPLIILHGVFGSLDNWLTISKSIADNGYVIYLVDQRNHGRSPHDDEFDYQVMASDLKEFLDDHGLENSILVGHSMGGKTVMQYAVNYPGTFDKLVVVDIAPKAYPIHHTEILRGLNAINLEGLENRKQAEEALSVHEPNKTVQQFLLKNLYRTEEGKFGWRFNLKVLTSDMGKIGKELDGDTPVDVPVLFMRGSRSDYVLDEDWEDTVRRFPQAILKTIQGTGHWVQAEQPQAFVDTLIEFLKNGK